MRAWYKVLVEELGCLALLALEDEAAHLGQMGQRLLGIVVVGLSAPERLLVQLDFLHIGAAVNHGTEMRVAYG